ncbi:hypothetical protein LPJ56_006496, partial [Coemansia sp. RSA 2599]
MASGAGPPNEAKNDTAEVLQGPAAAVHKHPFAAMNPDEDVTNEGVYVSGGNSDWEVNGVSKAVRVFIGSTSTEWMQRHQRWWTRTAAKLEGKTGAGRKIRRRGTKSDSTSDLFDMGSQKKNRKQASSESSASEDEVRQQQEAEGVEAHDESDWSSGSDQSIDEIGNEDPHSQCIHAQQGNSAYTQTSISIPLSAQTVPAAVEPDPSISSIDTIPLPMLPDSPTQDREPPNTAPVQSNTVRSSQSVMDIKHSGSEKARRRSSLSAIKGFFRRSEKKASAVPGQSAQSQKPATATETTATAADGPALTNRNTETTPMAPSRGRAASISGIAGVGASMPIITTPTKKTSSLRRTAVSRQARTVTWLTNEDGENAGAEDDQLLHSGWSPKMLLR